MLTAPNMLMIGSTGRNSGKTTFAEALIKQLSQHQPLIAAKVTTVQERNGDCPRGGQGCGVCSSLTAPYCITEETTSNGSKDTQRLLNAGAAKVYWLRVDKQYLLEGAQALLQMLGSQNPVICESNSLRLIIEPGLFLQFHAPAIDAIKTSASAVRTLADHTVTWDGAHFNLPPSKLSFSRGTWAFPIQAAAIILRARKKAGDAHAILQQLKPHFQEIQITKSMPDVHDHVAEIMLALTNSSHDLNLCITSDAPPGNISILRQLMRAAKDHPNATIIVPQPLENNAEPPIALFRKSLLPQLQHAHKNGCWTLRDYLAQCNVHYCAPGTDQKKDYTNPQPNGC